MAAERHEFPRLFALSATEPRLATILACDNFDALPDDVFEPLWRYLERLGRVYAQGAHHNDTDIADEVAALFDRMG